MNKKPKLYPRHLADLKASGISEKTAIRAGLTSCPAGRLSKILGCGMLGYFQHIIITESLNNQKPSSKSYAAVKPLQKC